MNTPRGQFGRNFAALETFSSNALILAAIEAERLAREEFSVDRQVMPRPPAARLESQTSVTYDTGITPLRDFSKFRNYLQCI